MKQKGEVKERDEESKSGWSVVILFFFGLPPKKRLLLRLQPNVGMVREERTSASDKPSGVRMRQEEHNSMVSVRAGQVENPAKVT